MPYLNAIELERFNEIIDQYKEEAARCHGNIVGYTGHDGCLACLKLQLVEAIRKYMDKVSALG